MIQFTRTLRIRLMAADPERILTMMSESDIAVANVVWINFLTIEITIRNAQYAYVRRLLQKEGIDPQIMNKEGILWTLLAGLKRPVLTGGLLLFIFAAVFLPDRILFVKLLGNQKVPESMILQYAQASGIHFGAKASRIRSEDAKNYLLEKLPDLQWVGITTNGCTATIRVKERSIPKEQSDCYGNISNIVAALDGVVTDFTVTQGTPLIEQGQSVKAGDILISGYTDTGLKITAQQAQGEVFAHTLRQLHVIAPEPTAVRTEKTEKHTCFHLRIGKKVINLCNHSGIHDGTCVKMYSEDYWTLPGGYQLPVSVMKTEYTLYETEKESTDSKFEWMSECAEDYLLSQMAAGQVLDKSLSWNVADGFCELWCKYACHEMIGRVKDEEILKRYAEDS